MSINDEFFSLLAKYFEESKTKSIKTEQAKSKFFEHLTLKNDSEGTHTYYKNMFYIIDAYFEKKGIKDTSQINDQLLRSLISYLLTKNLTPSYINKVIKTIKYMMNVLIDQELITPIVLKTPLLKTVEKPFSSFSDDELDIILEYASKLDLKHYLMVLILATTGVRRTELSLIQVKNIDFDDDSIMLEDTKTKKVRYVLMPSDVKELIKEYLDNTKVNKYLFENRYGEHLQAHSISTFLDKMKKNLNMTKLSAHMFRHTFATGIYESSGDLEVTRQLLGHNDYSMTKRYLHQSKKKLKAKYKKYSPIKSLKKKRKK